MIELVAVLSNHLRTEILDLLRNQCSQSFDFPSNTQHCGMVLGKVFGWIYPRFLLPTCDAWIEGQGNYAILIKGKVMYGLENPHKVRKDMKTGRM